MKRAFTLVEVLIIVAVLGILAAIATPLCNERVIEAKETAAKTNLHILREAIGSYAIQHNDVGPGYPKGDTNKAPQFIWLCIHLNAITNDKGDASLSNLPHFGPYISDIPANPFNGKEDVTMLGDSASFPQEASGNSGWIYKAASKTIKLNWPGTDLKDVAYYDY
ncbi:MAG: type II secretion system protein [Planctomycetota bacterium]|jgi:prepilin-type N-terminal cleavage/methylation domain-containing protein